MHILIIGNGFDLAHGLPTKYTDFLQYCRDYDSDSPVSEFNDLNVEFLSFIDSNLWLEYFLIHTVNMKNSETWIDFEKEISEIIHNIDASHPEIKYMDYINAPSALTLEFGRASAPIDVKNFLSLFCTYDEKSRTFSVNDSNIKSEDMLVEYLCAQLGLFARAFEIYCLYINSMAVADGVISAERSEQIKKAVQDREHYMRQAHDANGYTYRKKDVPTLKSKSDAALTALSTLHSNASAIDYLAMSKFDCVLSFNYTNTYERLYGNDNTQYCYIHGKAQSEKGKTDVIFGVDDDLPRGMESQNFTWIKFKKYFQRIVLKTSAEYKDWLDKAIQAQAMHNFVHIAGHSLDKTDYEILYEIFNNSRFRIIVYYYCQSDFEDKIQKVIKLLAYKGSNGRDELIQRVHGSQWSIKFVDQYDSVDGLFIRQPSAGVSDAIV